MRRILSQRLALLAVVLALGAGPVSSLAHAAGAPPGGIGTDDPDSRAGVIAAVLCGIFARAAVSFPHPMVIAGAVATCAFTFIDGLGSPD